MSKSPLDFKSIFESVPGLYLILDPHLTIVAVSESYLRATMTQRESLVGKHLFEAFPDNPEDAAADGVSNLRASLHRVLKSGKTDPMAVQKYDIRQPESEGGGFVERHWSCANSPVFGPNGKLTHIIHKAEDVTEFVRLQQQGVERADSLRREQHARAGAESANHRKDQLLAVLSHELRTPLTPVLAWIDVLKAEQNLSPQMQEGLEVIARNIKLEARLVEDLLDTTKISNGQLNLIREKVNAHQNAQAAWEIFRRDADAKQLGLTLQLQAKKHIVEGDPIRLQQIFWNLIGNAIKYTPIGGQICIRSENPDDGKIRIQIVDTGIGIEPHVMSRLFKSFEQGERTLSRKYGGLGLGLSIAKALVELHHGSLTVVSEGKDKGSTFTVDMGVMNEIESDIPAKITAATSGTGIGMKLLVVEDNEDTLRILTRLLQKSGHAVTTAMTVKSALQEASEKEFDLLISDIGLPDGTGWELMEKLRLTKSLPGIAVSGFIQPEDMDRSKEAGFFKHLSKPLDLGRLRKVIQDAALMKLAS